MMRLRKGEAPQKQNKLMNYAVVFKAPSSDKNILFDIEDFLAARGALLIYRAGPCPYFLFVVKSKPLGGQEDASGGKK
jgi:hypothetical protein